jgi:iron complex outermembrane receptor protein
VTFDADFYHIRFQNSYSSTLDSSGESVYFLQPSSITKGFEAESNIYFGRGLSAYLNASVGRASYVGTLSVNCAPKNCTGAPITVGAPSGLWVANTPSDVETEGVTYQRKSWDFGLFNKRVGTLYQDNGQYHNQAAINPFSVTNAFFNYTLRTGGRFDQTKLRLAFNNIFDQHSITGDSITGTALTQTNRRQRNNLHRSLQYHRLYTHRRWRQHQRTSRTQHYDCGNLRIVSEAIKLC